MHVVEACHAARTYRNDRSDIYDASGRVSKDSKRSENDYISNDDRELDKSCGLYDERL